MTSRQRFTPEFKLEAANLVVKQHYSVRDAASAMGVGRSTMDRWVKELRAELGGTPTHPTPMTSDHQKIKALETRIKRLEMEKEILKKATALLMSDSPSNFR